MEVELLRQAVEIDAKSTRVLPLVSAVTEGLVTLDIEVVAPKPPQADFMIKAARVKIKKTAKSERLNLRLLCAAPMHLTRRLFERIEIAG